MRRRWLALAVIVTAVSGCDNVAWGGVDMRLEAPPAPSELAGPQAASEAEEPEDEALPELPDGPLLLAGSRNGSSATLAVVGEIQGDGVASFPSEEESPGFRAYFTRELLAPGTEFVLFSEGVRVGRLTTSQAGVDSTFCIPRPTVTGTVELVPSASGARRLMALPASAAHDRPYEAYRAFNHNYDERVASLSLASEAIPRVSAPWPPSLLESRADIQAFRLAADQEPSIAATFLYQDRLSVAEPGNGAYALFIMGTSQDGTNYRRAYTWYRRADRDGKGAPRYFGHMDWDGDGESEVLLDVYGADSRWFAGLGRTDGAWSRTFQDPCGSGSTSPGS